MQPNIEIGDIVPETLAERNAYLPKGTEPATLGYIDPVTGAYVQKGLEALPPGFNAPSPNDAENIARIRALIAAQQPEPVKSNLPKNFQLLNAITQNLPGMDAAQAALAMATGYPAALAREMKFPEFADTIQYNPTNKGANEFLDVLSKIGEKTGPMAEFMVPNHRARTFTLDDFRVAKEMAKTDVAMPLAEMAYNHYMENGIPIPGLPQQFNTPGALYAVKPKGGNNPMNLGSTLPLEEQGEMGKYFSHSQITDPMKIFEERLETHFGNDRNLNRELKKAWGEYWESRKSAISGEVPEDVFNNPYSAQMKNYKMEAAKEFTKEAEKARLANGNPNVKKLYSPSEIEAAAKHHNEWLQGPMKKYVTNLMGTGLETDPLLKVMNESNIEPHVLFNQREPSGNSKQFTTESGADRRKTFAEDFSGGYRKTPELEEMVKNSNIGKQTATTPIGQYYEDLMDRSFYPKSSYSFPKETFPGSAFLKKGDVVPDFLTRHIEDELGFEQIQNRILDDILEGKIDPSKLPNRTPANVVQDMIKEKMAEMKALQKSKEVYHGWRQKNHDALSSDVPFTDADGNLTGTKLVIFDSKIANEKPELVTRNISQETKDLNHCVGACNMDNGKYIPMVEPHTGVANKADARHGPRYLEQMQKGEISIASLRGPNGESKATFELNPIRRLDTSQAQFRMISVDGQPKIEVSYGWSAPNKKDYFDTKEAADNHINALKTAPQQFKVSQLKGKDNKHVIGDEYINDAKNWLNYKHQTGELSSLPFEDIKNLPGVYDFSNIESYRELALSQEPKAHLANTLYDKAMRDKLKANPELKDEYQKGSISPSEVLPELGRFVTVDDIINKLAPK